MKRILILLSAALLLFCSCREKVEPLSENIVKPDFNKQQLDEKLGTDEIYIVKTYMESPADEINSYLEQNLIFTKVKHYLMSDGTWETDSHSYKYKLELKGRMHNAAKDSTFIVLSNSDDITFDMAWKAFGYSSNSNDYFNVEDAIIVAVA